MIEIQLGDVSHLRKPICELFRQKNIKFDPEDIEIAIQSASREERDALEAALTSEDEDALADFFSDLIVLPEPEKQKVVRPMEIDPTFLNSYLRGSIVQDIRGIMREKGVTVEDLAKRLNKNTRYVKMFLAESGNFPLEKIVEFACALDKTLVIVFTEPRDEVAIKDFDK